MNKKSSKKAGTTFVLIALFSLMVAFLPMQRVMASSITAINPTSGVVGTTILVNGAIDTPNGNFTVRWDSTVNVTSGKAVDINVNTSFRVPQTVGSPSGRSVSVELIDDTTGLIGTEIFTLYTEFHMQLTTVTPPRQLMEGQSAIISVNVTGGVSNKIYPANVTVRDPADQTHFKTISLSNTTTTGFGFAGIAYPSTDFGAQTHTNYTGTYIVGTNVTAGTQEFFVGLTDKPEYQRNETLQIRAAGYSLSEVAKIDIQTSGSSINSFPRNWTATPGGMVVLTWTIPLGIASGNYTVTVTNATTPGTVKLIKDSQDFRILGVVCQVRTKNLADEPVAGATVEVYNATVPNILLLSGNTNTTGWTRFNLDKGNYTFKAFFKNVEVGSLSNRNVTAEPDLTLQLKLVSLIATVQTEDETVPFVNVALRYSFTTRVNKTVSDILSMSTNLTGEAELHNLFTNKTYVVEARRYDLLFSNTTLTIEPSPASPLQSLTLTLPTYAFNVQAFDARDAPVSDIQIKVYEWTSGLTTPLVSLGTNNTGYASFSLPFGIYRLRAYKSEVFLDETVLYLVKNQLNFSFNLHAVNVDVTVSVFDYFGRPISNAEVRIERKGDQEYVPVDSKSTGADGSVLFSSIPLAGDSRISVYVAGRLAAAKTQFLGADSSRVTFNIGEYVAILGYPIETAVFTMLLLIVALVVVSLVLLNRKRLSRLLSKKPKK